MIKSNCITNPFILGTRINVKANNFLVTTKVANLKRLALTLRETKDKGFSFWISKI